MAQANKRMQAIEAVRKKKEQEAATAAKKAHAKAAQAEQKKREEQKQARPLIGSGEDLMDEILDGEPRGNGGDKEDS